MTIGGNCGCMSPMPTTPTLAPPGTYADDVPRNHDPDRTRCDCGQQVRYRVPVDDLVNEVYGFRVAGGYVDVCAECWGSDLLGTGHAAFVLDRVLVIEPDGTTRDPGILREMW